MSFIVFYIEIIIVNILGFFRGSRRCSIDQILASPESTAKTADSGIESLAKRLSEDTQLSSSLESSPVPPSTGNDQVDQALLYHLSYCDRLLEVSTLARL